MNASTKLTALERMHTLLMIAAGIAAGVPVLFWVPTKPHDGVTATDLIALGGSLFTAYMAAFITDTLITFATSRVRVRLRSAIALTEAKPTSSAD